MNTSKAAAALGSRGGLARAKNLTPEQLSAIGKAGAKVRWSKRRRYVAAAKRAAKGQS